MPEDKFKTIFKGNGHVVEEEIILSVNDAALRLQHVRLLTFKDGRTDLHCQTGDHHRKAIEKARRLLWERGLAVGEAEEVGPSGAYYSVRRLEK